MPVSNKWKDILKIWLRNQSDLHLYDCAKCVKSYRLLYISSYTRKLIPKNSNAIFLRIFRLSIENRFASTILIFMPIYSLNNCKENRFLCYLIILRLFLWTNYFIIRWASSIRESSSLNEKKNIYFVNF